MTSGPTPQPGLDPALRVLAEHLELAYAAEHMTLADPRTAAAFQVALSISMTVVAGAHAQGIVDEMQLAQLEGLLEGAKRAGAIAAGA